MEGILARIRDDRVKAQAKALYESISAQHQRTLIEILHHLAPSSDARATAGKTTSLAAHSAGRIDAIAPSHYEEALYSFVGISFSAPMRKKTSLCLHENLFWIETGAGPPEYAVRPEEIRAIIVVPTPASMRESSTFVLSFHEPALESWSFSILDDAPLQIEGIKGLGLGLTAESSSNRLLTLMGQYLPSRGPFKYTEHPLVLRPEARVFRSAAPNVQTAARLKRKLAEVDSDEENGAPASKVPPLMHMQAHINRKDGFLFLLPFGWIMFGFKKPLIVLSQAQIERVVFQGIVSRTFDLQIHLLGHGDRTNVQSNGAAKFDNTTFEMIDIAELPAVQAFVLHHLHGRAEADTPAYKSYLLEHSLQSREEKLSVSYDMAAKEEEEKVHVLSSDDDEDANYDEDGGTSSEQDEVPEEYQEDYRSEDDESRLNGPSAIEEADELADDLV